LAAFAEPSIAPPALLPIYQARRQRTVDLVQASAASLATGRDRISLASLVARSRALDRDGKGVSETAILRNASARSIYEQYRTTVQSARQQKARRHRDRPPAPAARLISSRRDTGSVRRRYLRLSKAELVERTIIAEQEFAAEREHRLRTADELLVWMQLMGTLLRSS
jgi:hypothetical protein